MVFEQCCHVLHPKFSPKLESVKVWTDLTILQLVTVGFGQVFGKTKLSKLLLSVLLRISQSFLPLSKYCPLMAVFFQWVEFFDDNMWRQSSLHTQWRILKKLVHFWLFIFWPTLNESVPHITVHYKWCHQNALAYINCESQWGEKLSGRVFSFLRN